LEHHLITWECYKTTITNPTPEKYEKWIDWFWEKMPKEVQLKLFTNKSIKKSKISFKLLKNQYFKIRVLNRFLKKKQLVNWYRLHKKWKISLFPRSESLFFDFIKTLNLVETKKIEVHNLLYLLGLVFKTLHKRKHSRFMYFIAEIFTESVVKAMNSIEGVKFLISGRLKGKSRASIIKFQKGRLNLNEIKSNVSYSQLHVYTLYGAFGMKLWMNYKTKNNK
jgi:hypothetical protein